MAFANNDDQTAKRLSELIGESTATKEQVSMSGGRFAMFLGNSSVAQLEYARPLMLPSEINRLPSDQELILVNGLWPILASKIQYFSDPRFKDYLHPPIILASNPVAALSIKPATFEPSHLGSAL